MHRPRSISAARRLRLASLLVIATPLLVFTAWSLLMVSFFANNRQLMISGSSLMVIGLVLIIVQWFVASHAGCPLCRTPVLASMGCVKHRRARRLLGSYKTRVATAIVFTDQFRCPYCNELTAMEVKERLSGSRPRGSEMAHPSRTH